VAEGSSAPPAVHAEPGRRYAGPRIARQPEAAATPSEQLNRFPTVTSLAVHLQPMCSSVGAQVRAILHMELRRRAFRRGHDTRHRVAPGPRGAVPWRLTAGNDSLAKGQAMLAQVDGSPPVLCSSLLKPVRGGQAYCQAAAERAPCHMASARASAQVVKSELPVNHHVQRRTRPTAHPLRHGQRLQWRHQQPHRQCRHTDETTKATRPC
jgi:hypothetical protein